MIRPVYPFRGSLTFVLCLQVDEPIVEDVKDDDKDEDEDDDEDDEDDGAPGAHFIFTSLPHFIPSNCLEFTLWPRLLVLAGTLYDSDMSNEGLKLLNSCIL